MKKEVEFDGIKYFVFKPNAKAERGAKLYQSVCFAEAIDNKVLTKAEIKSKRNKDDNVSSPEVEELNSLILKLSRGGYPKIEARADAIKMYKLRLKILSDLSNSSDEYTAEFIADEGYEDFIMHSCCKKGNGKLVFSSPEDYADKKDLDYSLFLKDEVGKINQLSNVLDSLEEIKFLKQYGYMNDEFEYINENGEVVDEDYKAVEKIEFVEFT